MSVTPRRNSPSKSPARIIASAISATKNSSRHMTRACRAIRCATSSKGCARSLMLREFRMHAAHEAIEVAAFGSSNAERGEEQVHQQRFAAAHTAPQVHPALRGVRRVERQPRHPRAQGLKQGGRLAAQILAQRGEARGCVLLSRVELQTMGGHLFPQAGAHRLRFAGHERRRAPCIRSLSQPTRLTRITQTGSRATGSGSWDRNRLRV